VSSVPRGWRVRVRIAEANRRQQLSSVLSVDILSRAARRSQVSPRRTRTIAQRILTSKAALEGERKLVTVLFADVKGSTELLAGCDPEEARRFLDPLLNHMIEAVHSYEGLVNRVAGDGIMALFGAPVAHEDHAVRASYAALTMQEAIRSYSRAQGMNAQIRVGLNSAAPLARGSGCNSIGLDGAN
jgi:class 3 adenylate cyclase